MVSFLFVVDSAKLEMSDHQLLRYIGTGNTIIAIQP